ncbi:hypothetical protein [Brachybacterium sp. p3-SID957]|uniref:hypothetical protein n=1 Tax=Brachybacterium sp. p3-SID957 TaxID=2916049 RepID=UPI00223BED3C|nr:hypothetical protein [Brachybacterium sp. p3-SID957]MCT1775529.1 hypothetical protein [Brachybacterium sp. p3-SID957]
MRPKVLVVAATITSLLLAGCSSPEEEPADEVQVIEGMEAYEDAPTDVVVGDDLGFTPVSLYAAGVVLDMSDGEATAPTKDGAVSIISAFDNDGNAVSAVVPSFAGLERAEPVVLDHLSTAVSLAMTHRVWPPPIPSPHSSRRRSSTTRRPSMHCRTQSGMRTNPPRMRHCSRWCTKRSRCSRAGETAAGPLRTTVARPSRRRTSAGCASTPPSRRRSCPTRATTRSIPGCHPIHPRTEGWKLSPVTTAS